MCAIFSRFSLVWTAIGVELWFAFEGTGVSTGGRAHLFAVLTKESNTCVQVILSRKLGFLHDGQPTVILRASHEKVNAWVCARPTTDCDPVSVIRDKKRECATEQEKNANLQLS